MKNYRFTFWLAIGDREYDEWTNSLFEAGGDDSSPGERGGKPFAAFHRDAESMEEAIRSARETVREAGLGVLTCEIKEEAMSDAWSVAAG